MATSNGSAKQDDLALLMAKGDPLAGAAEALGIAERTAFRWAAEASFKARVRELRGLMLGEAVGKLGSAAGGAVGTLVELLGDDNPPTVRCSAARAILSELIAVESHADLAERMADLERRFDEQQAQLGPRRQARRFGAH